HLLAVQPHRRRQRLDDRGFPQPTLASATGQDLRAGLRGFVEPGLDARGRHFVYHGTDVGVLGERIAGLQALRTADELADEGVVHALVHVHALHGDAGLSGVREAAPRDAFGGVREVGVVMDDDAGVAAELQRDALAPG